MFLDDTEYYRRRAIAESKLALKAERQDVAAIHEELARAYQAMVDHDELRPTLRAKFPRQDTEPKAEPSSFTGAAGSGA